MPQPIRVLFLCTANSARSQMAEGLLRHLGGGRFEAHSAGTDPAPLRPEAIAVMAEIGIPIAAQRSKPLDEFAGQQFHYVITVCDNAQRTCPSFPGARLRRHWSIPDPVTLDDFRAVRDQLRQHTDAFLQDSQWQESAIQTAGR